MKLFFYSLLLFCFTTGLKGQTEIIKIRRLDSCLCDYEFVAGQRIRDKLYPVGRYTISAPDKLHGRISYLVSSVLTMLENQRCFVNKIYFDSLLKRVYLVDNFKLSKVVIKQQEDTSSVEIALSYSETPK